MHLFGWGQRPVDRYKAYEYFCRAHRTGFAAAANNQAVCMWLGYGCKEKKRPAIKELTAVANQETRPKALRAMALVCSLLTRVAMR
jgi:hypothetical protein